MLQDRTTIGDPLLAKGIGDHNAVCRSIVNDIYCVITLCLVEVVRASRTLVIIGGHNTEVGHFAGRSQSGDQVVRTATTPAAYSTFLRETGIRIGWANLGKRSLI